MLDSAICFLTVPDPLVPKEHSFQYKGITFPYIELASFGVGCRLAVCREGVELTSIHLSVPLPDEFPEDWGVVEHAGSKLLANQLKLNDQVLLFDSSKGTRSAFIRWLNERGFKMHFYQKD